MWLEDSVSLNRKSQGKMLTSKSRKIVISDKTEIKLYSTHTNRLSSGNENHFFKALDGRILISVANRTNCSDQ